MRTLDILGTQTEVDVLLVNPGAMKAVYQGLSNEFSAVEMPVLPALFASYLRKNGITVDILDIPAFNLSPEKAAEIIDVNFSAKLIVFVVYGFQPSASTQNMTAAGATCSILKERNPNLKILMTGTHPAALPKRTLKEEEIDFVCDGEGPETIYELAKYLITGGEIQKVPALWYWHESHVASNPARSLLTNLDEVMPEPAFDLLPMDKYRAHNWHCFEHIDERQPYASLYTSLGCPYKCSFCCINAPFGKPSYRMWSPEWTIRQIDTLVNEYGVKNIKFVDEMFVLNEKHVIGICDHIIDRGYDLNIWVYARLDTIKEEFLDKLNRAGVRWLALGIESASKHVRDGVEKGRFSSTDILKVVRNIQDAGINVIGNYIFGLPDDTFESMQDTLDLAVKANCEFANFYVAMAYPGSKLYEVTVASGGRLPDSWIGYSQHSYECTPISTEQISSAEVLKFRDDAFVKYFTNNAYLKLVEKKFGKEVLTHINRMMEIKLPRKLYD